jgi:hypothetical protein
MSEPKMIRFGRAVFTRYVGAFMVRDGTGLRPIGTYEMVAFMQYMKSQRREVARTGQCEGGCSANDLITDRCGNSVCRRTMQSCPSRLRLIAERWAIVNQPYPRKELNS